LVGLLVVKISESVYMEVTVVNVLAPDERSAALLVNILATPRRESASDL
jgi:hypothetical protein